MELTEDTKRIDEIIISFFLKFNSEDITDSLNDIFQLALSSQTFNLMNEDEKSNMYYALTETLKFIRKLEEESNKSVIKYENIGKKMHKNMLEENNTNLI